MKRYANGYEWKTGERNYFINADNDITHNWDLLIVSNRHANYGVVYFSSKEEAEKAIEEIGEERLLRDYFRIPVDEL